MKVVVLADRGARVDEVVAELERAGHKAVVAGGRGVIATVIRAVQPAALLAVADDPVASREFLSGIEGAAGLPLLALPSMAGADEVSLIVGALTGQLGAAPAPLEPAPAAEPPRERRHAEAAQPVDVRSAPLAERAPTPAGPHASRSDRSAARIKQPALPIDILTPPVERPAPPLGRAAPPRGREAEPLDPPGSAAMAAQGGATRELVRVALEQARTGSYFDLLGLEPGATAAAVRQRVQAMTEALRHERMPGQVDAELEGGLREVGRALDDAWYVLGDDDLRSRYAAAIARAAADGPATQRT